VLDDTILRGGNMSEKTGNHSSTLVTVIFCEPSVASTIAALLRGGFADDDIHAFGILEGHAPAAREFVLAIGLPSDVVDFLGLLTRELFCLQFA
jgi:hypothetical protein